MIHVKGEGMKRDNLVVRSIENTSNLHLYRANSKNNICESMKECTRGERVTRRADGGLDRQQAVLEAFLEIVCSFLPAFAHSGIVQGHFEAL